MCPLLIGGVRFPGVTGASRHGVELFGEDGPGAEPVGSFPSESFGNTWLPALDHMLLPPAKSRT